MSTVKSARFKVAEPLREERWSDLSLGFDQQTQGPVLVRRFNKEMFADAARFQLFRSRFDPLAKVAVEGVLPIIFSGTAAGHFFLILAGSQGATLRARLEAGKCDLTAALKILGQAAGALDDMHAQGYVHGGVRSENLFFDAEDRLRLDEFATLHAICGWEGKSYRVDPNLVKDLLPPGILPPEALEGALQEASDQYSLAVVLLECVTGRPVPADCDPRDLLDGRGLTKARQAPLRVLRPVLARGLAPNPAERFGSCRELTRAAESAIRTARKRRRMTLAAIVLPLVILPTTFWYWNHSKVTREANHVTSEKNRLRSEIAANYTQNVQAPRSMTLLAAFQDVRPSETDRFDALLEALRSKAQTQQQRDASRRIEDLTKQLAKATASIRFKERPQDQTSTHTSVFLVTMGDLVVRDLPNGELEWTLELEKLPDVTTSENIYCAVRTLWTTSSGNGQGNVEKCPITLNKATCQGTVSPPSGSWKAGDTLSFEIEFQLAAEILNSKRHGPYLIGEDIRQRETVEVSPSKVLSSEFEVPTNVIVAAGDRLHIEATGSINPFSKIWHEDLGFSPGVFGPEGRLSDRKRDEIKLKEYDPQGVLRDRARAGILLARIGAKDWFEVGKRYGWSVVAESGQVLLSINSVRMIKGQQINKKIDAEKFWRSDGGHFVVTIERRSLRLPPGLSTTVQGRLKKAFD